MSIEFVRLVRLQDAKYKTNCFESLFLKMQDTLVKQFFSAVKSEVDYAQAVVGRGTDGHVAGDDEFWILEGAVSLGDLERVGTKLRVIKPMNVTKERGKRSSVGR